MGIQWFGAILVAWLVSPRTWIESSGSSISSLLLSFVLGGLFAVPSIAAIFLAPGERVTRYIIATSQVLFSVLLIHLSGGRIETHFHIFVSLAFLAFYMDMGVLWYAGTLVIIDHMLRGQFYPLSVYGQLGAYGWRWLEHGGWVLFENFILCMGIFRIRQELWGMASSKHDLILAKEEAQRASVMKSHFLSNMSHEIRTPLNSIIGFADLLSESNLEGEHREFASTIHRCSESLLVLINDILDFSKIENGLLQIDRHKFDVHQLHKDIHHMFNMSCREKGLALQIKVGENVPNEAVGDSHRLKQILVNLVGNAIKFTERGSVSVSVEKDADNERSYKWRVTDTGIGIAPENQKKLFKSFSQEHASTSRKYGGTGLGLVISKNLIELMGGNIAVDSKEGEGTTFSFTLKLDEL
ncbi:ATP-binding protein [Bdellovibrio sp. NC01]|uniref:ATP-binding protein n=1 Tax=Bdellovibrio sp. NC01 TaxID=2220073 RepID=UPI001FEE079D|nr:ATP-binding protein [Bdellovibrio sp. NC01]